jgi:hypothetical protein
MQVYIGTKMIQATPMNRLEYNNYRGWELPPDEDGSDEGFLVEYLDGGQSNHPDHKGYISWSPKNVFERAYHPCTGMDFGTALNCLKMGLKVARSGWNGKGMYVFLVKVGGWGPAPMDEKGRNGMFKLPEGQKHPDYLALYTAQGVVQQGWLASQTDMLAEDWEVVK